MNYEAYIRNAIGADEVLCQLAEEAAELAQAALKLRRAITFTNPTPISAQDARARLVEEYADVLLCADILLDKPDKVAARRTGQKKLQRWVERLEAAKGGEPNG